MVRNVRSTLVLAAALPLSACLHIGMRGTQPDVRRVAYRASELEVDARINAAVAIQFAQHLDEQNVHLSALWNIPRVPKLILAIIRRAPADKAYGPQLAVFREQAATFQVAHESMRLFDDDFIYPTFFCFSERTLLLADHGSEDAYGVIIWSFEDGQIRDLGELQIALPENGDVFARGVSPKTNVVVRDGAYVIRVPAPVLLYPREDREQLIGKRGEVVTFREIGGTFEIVSQAGRLTSR
jgi:hypothetical protein